MKRLMSKLALQPQDYAQKREQELLAAAERVCREELLCNLVFSKDEKELTSLFFPRGIFLVDNNYCLVGEGMPELSFQIIKLNDLESITGLHGVIPCRPRYAELEIDQFLFEFYQMGDAYIRLVLKVMNKQRFPKMPKYIHLHGECWVTNERGETFWAATIEISDALCDWLRVNKHEFEVVQPENFRL